MSNQRVTILTTACILTLGLSAQGVTSDKQTWSLKDCIDYALTHNVTLLKKQTTQRSSEVDVTESKAARLPSLSASISQNLMYRPFQESAGNFVNGGITTSGADKATQSGNYGINAQWVVWNGGKTKMNITNADYNVKLAAYDTEESANTIKEQIAQYYVQILYMTEALAVNKTLLRQDSTICARGEEMVKNGKMSQADLAQLQSQVSQGYYDMINTQTQIDEVKLQLRQLIELPPGETFDVVSTMSIDKLQLQAIPSKESIYAAALSARPEIKRTELAIEQSKLNTKIARSGYYPTLSVVGSLGDSHLTGSNSGYFKQMKNNFNAAVGLTLSIPIFDNRQTKSAIERAKIAEATASLDLQDAQKALYQTIETYWLNAHNSREKYVAARANVSSLETSYRLMSEQFNVGLKNIAELLTSRANLLTARQTLLQDKYTAMLNRSLLSFYADNDLSDLAQ